MTKRLSDFEKLLNKFHYASVALVIEEGHYVPPRAKILKSLGKYMANTRQAVINAYERKA